MWFGTVPIDDERLVGATLAHSAQDAEGRKISKGTVLDRSLVDRLREAGRRDLIVAILDLTDLGENEAARRLADALITGPEEQNIVVRHASTGRVNFHAPKPGILTFDRDAVNAFNSVSPAITIACLPPNVRVDADQMVATVKLIPFGVAQAAVEEAGRKARSVSMRVHPFRSGTKVNLAQTELATVKPSVLDKTAALTCARLESIGAVLVREERCAHETGALVDTIRVLKADADIVIVFGASAVADFEDVIPSAIVAAGGNVIHVGMPVDPGNLLVLGKVGTTWILGAPGCARSPKRNGFDWVLERLCAGMDVTSQDIIAMGVGGLLSEIESRPQPRAAK